MKFKTHHFAFAILMVLAIFFLSFCGKEQPVIEPDQKVLTPDDPAYTWDWETIKANQPKEPEGGHVLTVDGFDIRPGVKYKIDDIPQSVKTHFGIVKGQRGYPRKMYTSWEPDDNGASTGMELYGRKNFSYIKVYDCGSGCTSMAYSVNEDDLTSPGSGACGNLHWMYQDIYDHSEGDLWLMASWSDGNDWWLVDLDTVYNVDPNGSCRRVWFAVADEFSSCWTSGNMEEYALVYMMQSGCN